MQTVLIIDDQGLTRMILAEFVRSLGPEIEGKAFETPLDALDWASHNAVAYGAGRLSNARHEWH